MIEKLKQNYGRIIPRELVRNDPRLQTLNDLLISNPSNLPGSMVNAILRIHPAEEGEQS